MVERPADETLDRARGSPYKGLRPNGLSLIPVEDESGGETCRFRLGVRDFTTSAGNTMKDSNIPPLERLARRLHDQAFNPDLYRDPHSLQYKAGALRAIRWQLGVERKRLRDEGLPYPPGTPEMDAFFAGYEEGKAIHRRYLETREQKATG
jgi:transposase InsO family protein